MPIIKPKINYAVSGYYFIGLFVFVILGFWPSYFGKFFDGTADFNFYFHFHAAMMILWIFMLILQPILIRKKKLALHKFIGKLSYFLFVLMCISIILIINLSHSHNVNEENLGNTLLGQFKNFIIFGVAYFIAIRYRHNVAVHARAMIVTGIAFIEPALTRLILNMLGALKLFITSPNFFWYASVPTIIIIFSILIVMMIKERHQKKGRWVFPLTLCLYFILYVLMISQVHITLWESFAKWFVALPLT